MPLSGRAITLRICGISLFSLPVMGQVETDTTARELKMVVVVRKATTTSVGFMQDGTMQLDAKLFELLPKVLGNVDPVHYAQMLPGVQTNSELDAGLHIQGSDNTHNLLSIQGVPIYNAAHMLGLFSVFNASHYASMSLKKSTNEAGDASRLGGMLRMNLPDVIPDSLRGEASVGLISSQGTLRFPTGKKSGMTLSGRGSYINLLYSRWLTTNDMDLDYSFCDANATWQWKPNERDNIWVDAFWGLDRTKMTQDEYLANMKLNWGNHEVALHWLHDSPKGLNVKSSIYNTRAHNGLRLSQSDMVFQLPSDICDVGWRSELKWKGWKAGAETVYHSILPQSPKSEKVFNQVLSEQPRQHTQEYTLFAGYTHKLFSRLTGTLGLRTSAYIDYTHKAHLAADPSLRLRFVKKNWMLAADYALRHQYLFQTGTTALGMPTEFWCSIGEECPPQWGHNISASVSYYLLDGRYRISGDIYYKRLYNQVEYDGDMMKFLNTDYKLSENLLHGDGYNYGFSLMFSKNTGNLTGWINYAYGRARRRFKEYGFSHYYSASHERPHELNALLSYKINKHWTVATTYVFASGTPFTAPQRFYILNGMLLTEYGPHNARRLRPYNRLDLSVNYLLPTRHLRESGLNLSLYNVTMQHNDITCRLKVHNGHYLYSHFSVIKFILPSISYFLKF